MMNVQAWYTAMLWDDFEKADSEDSHRKVLTNKWERLITIRVWQGIYDASESKQQYGNYMSLRKKGVITWKVLCSRCGKE